MQSNGLHLKRVLVSVAVFHDSFGLGFVIKEKRGVKIVERELEWHAH